MKKTIVVLLLLVATLVACKSEAQTLLPAYQGVTQFISTVSRVCNVGNTYCRIIASGAQYHQLSWNVSGTLSACTLQVDSSADGVTWNSGDILASRSCTSNGNATSTALTVNYVSVNITAITPVTSATLAINLTGYANNPAGTGGTVTSVTASTPVTSSGGNTPNIACPTCAIGPGASTANHIVQFSGTDGLTLKDGGVGGSGTVTNTGGALTANAVVLGAGGNDSKVSTGITTNGASELDLGVSGTSGVLGLNGSTSGKSTFTPSAVAGTAANPVTATNTMAFPTGSGTNPSIGWSGGTAYGINFLDVNDISVRVGGQENYVFNALALELRQPACDYATATGCLTFAAGLISTTGSGNPAFQANAYQTKTNCAFSASPAVCGSAAAGFVLVPTGTNPTLVVNTTAIGANSEILFSQDTSLGTALSTTCNSSLAIVSTEPIVIARVANTSFTIQINGVVATNGVCLSYWIVNK
jgi:hypothetical protein